MKNKNLSLKAIVLFILSNVFLLSQAQVQIYYEDFGTPPVKSTPFDNFTGWREQGVYNDGGYSWDTSNPKKDIDIRNNQESKYPNGCPLASKGGNVYLNGGPVEFWIAGISTQSYHNLKLSFGLFGKSADAVKSLIVESMNDPFGAWGVWTTIKDFSSYTNLDSEWQYVSNLDGLPQTDFLVLRFRTTSDVKIRLDDILITGTTTAALPPVIAVTSILNRFEATPSVPAASQTILVNAENLLSNENITLALSPNSPFTLSQYSISQAELPKEITIDYSSQAVGYDVDTLFLNTLGLLGVNKAAIVLKGKCNFLQPQNQFVAKISEDNYTLNWDAVPGATQYLINITKQGDTGSAENVIFNETFSKMVNTSTEEYEFYLGERIDGIIMKDLSLFPVSTFMDNGSGWKGEYLYLGSDDDAGEIPGVIRVGKKDGGKGTLYTPKIDLSGDDVYLKFKIRTFSKSNQKEENEIKITHFQTNELSTVAIGTLKNLSPEFYEYTFKISNGKTGSNIKFESSIATNTTLNNRFILDDIKVIKGGVQTDHILLNQLVENDNLFVLPTTLVQNETYVATVAAYDPTAVFISPAAQVQFKLSDITSSDVAPQASDEIQVYVQNGKLYVELESNNAPIRIYNILGQEVSSKQGKIGQNILSLTTGKVYIVKVGEKIFKMKM